MRKPGGQEKPQNSGGDLQEAVLGSGRRQRVPVTGEARQMPNPVGSRGIQVKRVPEGLVDKYHLSTYASFFAVLTVL